MEGGGWGGGRFGGVRIAGCGWVRRGHVSRLAPLAWKDVVDGGSGSARPASLSAKRGVSAATPQPAAGTTPLLFR